MHDQLDVHIATIVVESESEEDIRRGKSWREVKTEFKGAGLEDGQSL